MKLNNFFKQLVFAISISMAITACSVLSKKDTTYNKKNTKLDHFKDTNVKKDLIIGTQSRFEMQELRSDNTIYFSLDQYDISSQFFDTLNIHAHFLCNNPLYSIKIEGHADERGTPEYNIALGERRANSVKSYLQSKGVLSEQILTVSYGKEKPAILGHNEEAYSKNRRVVLIYK